MLSLRAFARFLQIPPSRLSEIFSGKRQLSLPMAEHISKRLGLDPKTQSEFISSVLKGKRKKYSPRRRASPLDRTDPEYKQLTLDAFHVIADWYHFAILNLRDCDDFRPNETWIAKRLNIGIGEVRLALTRFERLGLIECKNDGSWVRTHANLTTTHDVRSAGLRKGHRGILQRAIESIESVDISQRDITNMTMAINPGKLPEAKKMLARFRKKFAKFLEQDAGRTEVYTLAMQLFPLTEPRKSGKREKKL